MTQNIWEPIYVRNFEGFKMKLLSKSGIQNEICIEIKTYLIVCFLKCKLTRYL